MRFQYFFLSAAGRFSLSNLQQLRRRLTFFPRREWRFFRFIVFVYDQWWRARFRFSWQLLSEGLLANLIDTPTVRTELHTNFPLFIFVVARMDKRIIVVIAQWVASTTVCWMIYEKFSNSYESGWNEKVWWRIGNVAVAASSFPRQFAAFKRCQNGALSIAISSLPSCTSPRNLRFPFVKILEHRTFNLSNSRGLRIANNCCSEDGQPRFISSGSKSVVFFRTRKLNF